MPRVLALLLVGALLIGCGTGSVQSNGDAQAPGSGDAQAPATVLDFTGATLAGEEFSGASLAGSPAVLWFWAPWCPTCRAQIPNLTSLAAEYGDRVSFVGVGGLASEDDITQLAGSIDHLVHLIDLDGDVWRHFGVTAQSTYEVIDADGRIVSSGFLTDADLNTLVADLAP
ncbi:TlpA family protein disulfide reductase [Nocardioides limicola]|uniref:TlpA family protein disulfide reductase n=1 Tax=Nocardioides limicola TaxID=2803368 RepID=UPI00193C2616|nr:redoxin family protein [Nocardioides sp. DJM-14]